MGTRRARLRVRAAVAVCAAGSLAAVFSCLGPTEVTLLITTDVDCAGSVGSDAGAVIDTMISVGSTGNFTMKPGVAVTSQCTPGPNGNSIGTFVVIPDPGASSDEGFAVQVVTGVGTQAKNCATETPPFAGCIVERRSLSFIPHTPLTVPIVMERDCEGVSCNPTTTCELGACVPIMATCSGATCTLPPDDGGVNEEVGASEDATGDGQGADRVAEAGDSATADQGPDVPASADVSVDMTPVEGATPEPPGMDAPSSDAPGMDATAEAPADVAAEATGPGMDATPEVGVDATKDAPTESSSTMDASSNDAAAEASPPVDAGGVIGSCLPQGTTTGVACGGGNCAGGDVCCILYDMILVNTSEACTTSAACPPGYNSIYGRYQSALGCRNQGDCPGTEICCGTAVNSGASSTCVAAGSCPTGFSGQVPLCHNNCECGALTCKAKACANTGTEVFGTCGGTCP